MLQEFIPEAQTTRKRPKKAARKRYIGMREIIFVLIALSLLALAPSMANIAGIRDHTLLLQTDLKLGDAEIPERNFPGSAFYFLDEKDSLQNNQHLAQLQATSQAPLDEPTAPYDVDGVGDSARPFILRAGNMDYARALKCLTDAIYYEAATEPDAGQRAVAQVILNRMRHPTYPNTVCGVVYQGSERGTGCQFSYSCDGSMARMPARFYWDRARNVASAALAGSVYSPVGMATHYHTVQVSPYWAPSLHFIGTIGAHRFYRWKGSAGRPSAFFRQYAGNEPFPGPKPRVWNAVTPPSLDPIQLQQQYEREFAAARVKAEAQAQAMQKTLLGTAGYSDIAPPRQRPTASYAAPEYSREAAARGGDKNYGGENLPGTTNIKSEFQQSGSWKKQPVG